MSVGVMIETPSAAILASALAEESDFLSVGTNDLVQYLLAADRIGGGADSNYEPLHPAVIRTLAALAITARTINKPISLCGEIAGDPRYTALLLGLGFRSFSVTPGRLLEIKHAIRSIDLRDAEQLAATALTLDSAPAIRALVEKDWQRRSPVSSPDISGATVESTATPGARRSGALDALESIGNEPNRVPPSARG
jgi:phosphotransferase system enzyme I (PtsI)